MDIYAAGRDLPPVSAPGPGPDDARFHARILASLGRPVIVTDLEGHILYWNDAAREVYGWSPEEAVGRQIYYLIPAALPDDAIDRMMEAFAAGEPWSGELRIRRKDGEWVPTFHTDRVLRDEAGRAVAIVSVSDDLRERETLGDAAGQEKVTKGLVRDMLRHLSQRTPQADQTMRRLGRDLARRANSPGLAVFLETFSAMGLGDLKLDDVQGHRHVFSGSDLLERRESSRQPTCQLPLGFLEGAIEVVTGAPALGAELACQSTGGSRCSFVVSARPRG